MNETSFAVLTLLQSPMREQYRPLIERLGAFLIHQQRQDGKFSMWHPLQDNDGKLPIAELGRQRYASGEAALACVRLYQALGEKRYMDCAQKAFSFYYPLIRSAYHNGFASWHAMAYAELYIEEPRADYLDALRFLAGALAAQQNRPERGLRKTVPGGFDRLERSDTSSEAVYTEALGFASRAAHAVDPLFAGRMRQGNLLGLYNLRFFQSKHHTNPLIRGGISTSAALAEIRVDNVGHALTAFYEYLTRMRRQ
jgi:hypothetical protein